ncbi:hypothetical protein ACIQGT_40375 [Streptomyces sp. NPDC093108]
MALDQQISLAELRRRNEESQQARAAEKPESDSTDQQQTGR